MILVFTAPPKRINIAATATVIKPPATAYSTMVRPSSSLANLVIEVLIVSRFIFVYLASAVIWIRKYVGGDSVKSIELPGLSEEL
ncbi:hypothetical protein D3C84_1061510 [compost metagenome]